MHLLLEPGTNLGHVHIYSWCWMCQALGKLGICIFPNSLQVPHRNSSCGSKQRAWTTKQALAADTNCQNFTGKGKTKECELLHLTSSHEANTIHGGKGEKRGKKKKNKQEKRKKKGGEMMLYPQCPWGCWSSLQLGAGCWPGEQVFLPGHSWTVGPGQCHPGEWHPGQCHSPASLPLLLCLELLCSVPRTRGFVITLERFKSSLGAHG